MMRFEFGIFDSFDLGGVEPGQVMTERLEFAVEAERVGFDHYHLAEHHGTPLSVCPSPNLFLSALTQRTRTIRMGALVYVLPAYDPFRLAEEIAALDQLSGGRPCSLSTRRAAPWHRGVPHRSLQSRRPGRPRRRRGHNRLQGECCVSIGMCLSRPVSFPRFREASAGIQSLWSVGRTAYARASWP